MVSVSSMRGGRAACGGRARRVPSRKRFISELDVDKKIRVDRHKPFDPFFIK